jgi:hypothetical protein
MTTAAECRGPGRRSRWSDPALRSAAVRIRAARRSRSEPSRPCSRKLEAAQRLAHAAPSSGERSASADLPEAASPGGSGFRRTRPLRRRVLRPSTMKENHAAPYQLSIKHPSRKHIDALCQENCASRNCARVTAGSLRNFVERGSEPTRRLHAGSGVPGLPSASCLACSGPKKDTVRRAQPTTDCS